MSEDPAVLTKALESLLVEKGLITSARIDEIVKNYEEDIGPMRGAQVVARAWSDPAYKKRLLADGRAAIAEFGFTDPHGAELMVTENTDDVHNMVVCTLCSCYPWSVLGLPPTWYKSFAYRSRAVSEPRSVLKEFGLEIPESTEVRVWDSNSDIRYMVLPKRPADTEGMSEEELAEIVTRDSMIGVGEAGRAR
ncbi:MAG TPA: nitrile hydratase subunit alpha [Candidatus Latescibacteria bacterium]|mgnify:FL=1|jgi:nitrile hydratase|nr:nitrile hydratase subunit alpha [Gemmatimonadota bacterium]MDP7363711.1 nitrile hydratase subunit alpha [Candidatus Latescibacterota bacterium]MDP7634088.1 nitrile hydratase subunit alpha [Candidatus Latescibacterota bacterium]HCV25313.1 nitrile hydratase subunit alpha [Candidatus Latescibacterota bacterium]HJN29845.1 nitrile hydratase subunit alpha [Candidatus Latescibacterota bacterium]|tara:strand:+ start:1084 stop:1662 length:579 start_codon:yes stop_codon:yes gene_type:complete